MAGRQGDPGAETNLKEAEALARRALTLREQRLGKFEPSLSAPLPELALVRRLQGDHEESEHCFTRAVALAELLGMHHPFVAMPISLMTYNCDAEEEEGLRRAALIFERKYNGRCHLELCCAYGNLATSAANQP